MPSRRFAPPHPDRQRPHTPQISPLCAYTYLWSTVEPQIDPPQTPSELKAQLDQMREERLARRAERAQADGKQV